MAKQKRDDVAVKIDKGVYRQAKQVASRRGIPLAKYLSEKLAVPVGKDYREVGKEIASESDNGKKG